MSVCVGGGGGGGERKTKQFLVKENQVMEHNQTPSPPPIPNPVSDVITIPPPRFRKTCQTSNQLEIEDSKKNRSLLDKHYFKTTTG